MPDVNATSVVSGGVDFGNSLTLSLTTPTTANRVLYVCPYVKSGNAHLPAEVTYGGVALTLVADDGERASLWRLVNPTPATASLVIELGSGVTEDIQAGAFVVTDAHQSDHRDAVTKAVVAGTTNAITVPSGASASGELVIAMGGNNGSTSATSATGQTERYNSSATNVACRAYAASKAGASGGVTLSWSLAASQTNSLIAISIKPAVTGGGGTATPIKASRPTIIVEAAFGVGPFAEPTSSQWKRLDLAGNKCSRLSFRHGKSKRYEPLDPAEATLLLNNRNGNLDPNWTESPYYPNVKRDTQVRVFVDTADRSNLLGYDQATFEGSRVVGWENNVSASIDVTRDQQAEGERSMIVEATATGRVSVRTLTGTAGIPVQGGKTYTALASVLASASGNAQARPTNMFIAWYDSAGTLISTSADGPTLATTTIAFREAFVTATAPSTAAFALIGLDVADSGAAVGDIWLVDKTSLALGTRKPWTIPGGVYPLIRGHALEWDADYDTVPGGRHTCRLVVTDISRLLAEQMLWPSVAERDILGGHAGDPPASHFAMDERANQHNAFDIIDKTGNGRLSATSNDPRGSGGNVLQWDYRPFKSFGGGTGQGAQTMFVRSLSSAELDAAWSIDFLFRAERVGPPVQTILNTSEDKLRLFIWEDSTLQFEVVYTDGTTAKIITPFPLIPGPIEHVTLVAEADGLIELYLNRELRGFVAGNGRTPAWWGNNLLIAADRGGGFGFRGEIGRLSLYTYRRFLADIRQLNDAIKFPWTFNTTAGARAAFLLAEFRHRKDTENASIPGTHPGVPFSLQFIDDPSDVNVQAMNPAGRSVLDYLRALESTEFGYLKVKHDGRIRARRRARWKFPRAAGVLYDNRLTPGTTAYTSATLGRSSDVITSVAFRRSGTEAEATRQSTAGMAAFGEVSRSLVVESSTIALAQQAAQDVLDRNAINPPMPTARVELNPPAFGWAAAMREPGDAVRLDNQLPKYLHSQGYEVLEVNHDGDAESGEWRTTLSLVGNP